MNCRTHSRKIRFMLVIAALPLLQAGGCGLDLLAGAIAAQATTEVATPIFTSLETVLLNAFGV